MKNISVSIFILTVILVGGCPGDSAAASIKAVANIDIIKATANNAGEIIIAKVKRTAYEINWKRNFGNAEIKLIGSKEFKYACVKAIYFKRYVNDGVKNLRVEQKLDFGNKTAAITTAQRDLIEDEQSYELGFSPWETPRTYVFKYAHYFP
jgi:hypothetical protein